MHKKIFLVGAKGMLAQKVVQMAPRGDVLIPGDLPEFDMTDPRRVFSEIDRIRPDIIINCAAYTQVDRCETEEFSAIAVNGTAVGTLAEAAGRIDATLVHISTDYVFSGASDRPYLETDPTGPESAYGRSKLLGEQLLLTSGLKKYFIVRTSWLYGPGGPNFVETMVRLAKERETLRVVSDQIGAPTYTEDLAEAIFNLLALEGTSSPDSSDPYGIYHFSNSGQCSWFDFATEIVASARKSGEPVKVRRVEPIATDDYPLPAKRPAYSVLSKEKYLRATGKTAPDWQDGLSRYFVERSSPVHRT